MCGPARAGLDRRDAVEFQLFGAQCTVDTRRLSRYEAIPDFARAHGMCSFRDWSVLRARKMRRAKNAWRKNASRKKCVATTTLLDRSFFDDPSLMTLL